jgi:hypothetical protein
MTLNTNLPGSIIEPTHPATCSKINEPSESESIRDCYSSKQFGGLPSPLKRECYKQCAPSGSSIIAVLGQDGAPSNR